jgi:AcrR family transcriptional regulator
MLTRPRSTGGRQASDEAYATAGDPPSKRRILDAALRLFARKGIDAVTVREIAAEAGYTNPALFKFFATKDALALHLFESCYLQLFDSLHTAAADGLPFDERLSAILAVFVSALERDPEAFLFVQDRLREIWPRVSRQTRRKSILALIRSILQQGVREGAVDATLPLDLLVAAFTGTLQQFARMLYFGDFKGPARDWSPALETILRRLVQP